MFCSECGKEIKNGKQLCDDCEAKINRPVKGENNSPSLIKNFVLTVGRFLVDFDVIIGIILAFIVCGLFILTACGSLFPNEYGYFENINIAPACIVLAIVVPIIMLIFVVVWHYLIYLLIDIKDSLVEIKKNIRSK